MNIELIWPPTVNRYSQRNHKTGKRILSEEWLQYREHVLGACLELPYEARKSWPVLGRLSLFIDAYPPDRRRRDLDNIIKAIQDSLTNAGVWKDDSQIDLLLVRRLDVKKGGKVIVNVKKFADVSFACASG